MPLLLISLQQFCLTPLPFFPESPLLCFLTSSLVSFSSLILSWLPEFCTDDPSKIIHYFLCTPIPTSLRNHIFIFILTFGYPSNISQIFISATFILILYRIVITHVSHPYVNIDLYIYYRDLIFVLMKMSLCLRNYCFLQNTS